MRGLIDLKTSLKDFDVLNHPFRPKARKARVENLRRLAHDQLREIDRLMLPLAKQLDTDGHQGGSKV